MTECHLAGGGFVVEFVGGHGFDGGDGVFLPAGQDVSQGGADRASWFVRARVVQALFVQPPTRRVTARQGLQEFSSFCPHSSYPYFFEALNITLPELTPPVAAFVPFLRIACVG